MEVSHMRIDAGKPFDWGRVSEDYARFRDIYPPEFYAHILDRELCQDGQRVLDIGTGTGVLPRNLYPKGAKWTGVDPAASPIAQAHRLSEGMEIDWAVMPVGKLDFQDEAFDVATACQCFWYFDHEKAASEISRVLRSGGTCLMLMLEFLPGEDKTIAASEELVLKYNPAWPGAGETLHPIEIPAPYYKDFELIHHEEFFLDVPFTRESWNGRMKACRGIGASLSDAEIAAWEEEHLRMLEARVPEAFTLKHFGALAELRKR